MVKKRILTGLLSVIMSLGISSPIANIQTFASTELLKVSDFTDGTGLPWTEVETPPSHADCDISGGSYNIKITNVATGSERFDLQFRYRNLTIMNGCTYSIKFTVKADKDCQIYPKLGESGGKFAEFWNYGTTADDTLGWKMMPLKGGVPTTVDTTFKVDFSKQTQDPALVGASECPGCEIAFELGGINGEGQIAGGISSRSDLPITYSFSDIHLLGPSPDIPPIELPSNAIRVNQVGYYPSLEKTATLVTNSTDPVPWQLHNSAGTVVATGTSKIYKDSVTGTNVDKASGDKVQIIDFSSYKTVGKGYYLTVDSKYIDPTLIASTTVAGATLAKSMPFDIGMDIYTQLKKDSINYFYQNRSGIDITMPYCVRTDLARVEGIKDIALKNVPDSGYTGDNDTYNVEKGWFDAGDHGKYVVNGGISVWTLMNEYERALNSTDKTLVTKAPFADGTMNIPENANKIPDILDETRWEIEFMLGMQIPDGTYAGMVHHSAHDVSWTALCTRPDEDYQTRYVYPPSTQATLNLAASAAEAARLWKNYDSAFASKCLTAAKAAYTAAKANPTMYFKTGGDGGGDYADTNTTDEFYWAACELYATTGDSTYLADVKTSDKYLQMPTSLIGGEDIGSNGAFDWGNVAGLGTLTLVTAKNSLPFTDIVTAKANIAKAADSFISTENTQGYGSAITEALMTVSTTGEKITGYPYESNSYIENEAIVMAYAYDFTGNVKYINGVAEAMDYLMGRNPNIQCYVTGYGTNALKNPYHRFWSYQEDNTYPQAPAGCISGGPNSGLEDQLVYGLGWKAYTRPSEKNFTDNIESWSTNDVSINLNAPLSWLTSYMDYSVPYPPIPSIGDVNTDGKINVLDYLLLEKAVNGKVTLTGTKLRNADTNDDGTVTSADLTSLRNYLIHKVKALPSK
ncbi:MAG: glycoside hydrolase family 9 protein [Bacillota bacterium]|nr:glycoside hydrolase family 9 protein [Bacillota bacterium]